MKGTGWLDIAEAGGTLGIRFFVVTCTMFGRGVARACLPLVALYYTLFHGRARRASADWIRRARGPQHVSLGAVYIHLLRFAQVTVDRLFCIRRQLWRFDIRYHGKQWFKQIRSSKRGVIMLGAHLGSFEIMRACAEIDSLPINILGYFGNAKMINNALRRLDTRWEGNFIEITPGRVDFVLEIRSRIERGEHVAILGDRVGLGGDTVQVDFMGAPALFPAGVYILAAALHCPVYLFLAVHTPPNRYDIHCELFAEQIVLPRKARLEGARRYAQQYARRLEHYGRAHPDNWFNFYDFWSRP